MNRFSNKKNLRHKMTALLLSICLSAVFAPSVFAESPSDITTTAAESTTSQATQETQATSATQAASAYTQTANAGFENVESDGGTMLVGTARIPKADGSFATVKFIYSSGIHLNDKSLSLINTELTALGVTISGGMIYVSGSDIVSDSSFVTETSERQAVFACGSEAAPTVLKAYPAYQSVEESFEYLYRGYVYSVSDYTSLTSVLGGRSEITLSDDGKSAYTSIVMEEDYVDKVINGKTVRILMINSELKYCFRAPRLVYVKDDSYNVASASDIVYHYGTTTEPDTSSTTQTGDVTSSSDSASETTDAISSEELIVNEESTTAQTTASTVATTTSAGESAVTTETTSVNIWDYLTTAPQETKITAGASPIVTSATTSTTTAAATTAATTAPTDTAATTAYTSAENTTTSANTSASASATLPTMTTQSSAETAVLPNVTTYNPSNSQRAIVNTRRLSLNIRSGPGMNYMVVTVLPKGTYVTVLDTSNPDWYMVKTMGKVVGYAYSGYIKFM